MADGGRPEPTFSWKIGDQKIAPHIVSTDANRLGSQVGDIGHIVSTYTNRLGSEMNYRPLEDRCEINAGKRLESQIFDDRRFRVDSTSSNWLEEMHRILFCRWFGEVEIRLPDIRLFFTDRYKKKILWKNNCSNLPPNIWKILNYHWHMCSFKN